MSYTDFYTQKKRKHVLTVLLVLLALTASFAIVRYALPKRGIQAQNTGLSDVQITNIFPTQATIIWKSAKNDKGWLVWGTSENDLGRISYDDRDDSGKTEYTYHSVTLKDLKPNTSYYFKITNGSEIYTHNGKNTFTFTSIDNLKQSAQNKPAYGKYTANNQPVGNAIIVIEHPSMYPLSTITKSSGEWLIPFNYTVNRTNGKLQTLKPEDVLTIHVYDESGKTTIVRARASQLSPLKTSIARGVQTDLTAGKKTEAKTGSITLIYPKKDAVITADTPLIKGTAPAGSDVVVALMPTADAGSTDNAVYYTATADKDGIWKLSLSKALAPGAYTIEVKPRTTNGDTTLIAHSFTIAKSGTQVLGESTPGGTITPTASPSPTLTGLPTPTATASATPTLAVSPTVTQPTLTPFATATPVLQITATPGPLYADLTGGAELTPTPPVAGISVYPLAITSAAMMLFGAALLVIF